MPIVNGEPWFFKPSLEPEHIPPEELGFNKDDKEEMSYFRILIKEFKKLPYVPFPVLEKVLEGKVKTDRELFLEVKTLLQEKNLPTIVLTSLPHAKVNRISGSTAEGGEFFFEESYYLPSNLHFLIAVSEESFFEKTIIPALKLLQDFGLGGNKSIGFGSFSFSYERYRALEPSLNSKEKKFITLSEVVATNKINYEKSFYEIETYKGTVESGYKDYLWKPKVFYLKAGSLISLKESEVSAGALMKIDDELYHYGLEFPLFIKERER